MIKKKGKKNLVLDLCIINLMEADFNFNNKILARNTMRYAEENHFIPKKSNMVAGRDTGLVIK
jgi:hypothetical protein